MNISRKLLFFFLYVVVWQQIVSTLRLIQCYQHTMFQSVSREQNQNVNKVNSHKHNSLINGTVTPLGIPQAAWHNLSSLATVFLYKVFTVNSKWPFDCTELWVYYQTNGDKCLGKQEEKCSELGSLFEAACVRRGSMWLFLHWCLHLPGADISNTCHIPWPFLPKDFSLLTKNASHERCNQSNIHEASHEERSDETGKQRNKLLWLGSAGVQLFIVNYIKFCQKFVHQ